MNNKNKAIIFLTLFTIAFGQEVNLSPLRWGEGEIDKYITMDTRAFPDNPIAIGKNGAINAGLFAASILSNFDKKIKKNLENWRAKQTKSVKRKPK